MRNSDAEAQGLGISTSLIELAPDQAPAETRLVDARVLGVVVLSAALGVLAAGAAEVLTRLIALFTQLSFYGRVSTEPVGPAGNTLGAWVILVPVGGALIVGLMARFGSQAIRGHGIPEAMEQVLMNRSRIPARITLLKPLSAAISIGTGGPFGAEGPIIATGGALGSLFGQLLSMTAQERKTLLAAGAAAGMAATFGSPVSAVLLAMELLLFEVRPRSLIAVALASTAAAGVRMAIRGAEPMFAMPDLAPAPLAALAAYVLVGAAVGAVAALATRAIYAIEDGFDRLPIHWMWWPALGAVVVGVVGWFEPRVLGVGYDNIRDILAVRMTLWAVVALCALKFVAWSIALGSGTSGGTLAPLFTVGGGAGAALGALLAQLAPWAGIDPRMAALVGMAAMFAGASRAFLASAVFAFETTLQPAGALPLLGGCAAAYLVSFLAMRHSIMTEKIARRGVAPPAEYHADVLGQVLVREVASRPVVTLRASDSLASVRAWLQSGASDTTHQGFPVLDERGFLAGVVTRRDLLDEQSPGEVVGDRLRGPVRFVYEDSTVRQATDHMVRHGIGRLPVLTRGRPPELVGIITRSDVLSAYRHILDADELEPGLLALGRRRGEANAVGEPPKGKAA